jgi:hypothetical protein
MMPTQKNLSGWEQSTFRNRYRVQPKDYRFKGFADR